MGREEEGGFRMGTRVYLWWIHVDIWQNQYNIVKLKNKIKKKESCVRSVCWDYPLEEGMEIHSRILAWRIPMDRGAWWATVRGVAQSQT